MNVEDVATPCLLVDLDSFERNVERLRQYVVKAGVRLRTHAKTHKCYLIAKYQIEHGGACGVCCQKVSEAEALVDAGLRDVLITNQIVAPAAIERLLRLSHRARIIVCVDHADNVAAISAMAIRNKTNLECLVEIDVGADRCGVRPGSEAVTLALAVANSPGLTFRGLQAYHGPAQHFRTIQERGEAIGGAISKTRETIELLHDKGLVCDIVGGAGTGSFRIEGASGVYNELQCGSYIFMDADYVRNKDDHGHPVAEFEHSLFLYTAVMSKTSSTKAICDAGLKSQSIDSGLPVVYGRDDIKYIKCSDEHGVIADPHDRLRLNEKIRMIPGHCDPTVNIHDWFVVVRDGKVADIWPITARGACL